LCASVAYAQPPPFVCGDANQTGTVTVTDGVQALVAAADLGGRCATSSGACDVDRDGRVTVTDGVNILRLAAGLRATARCENPLVGNESAARIAVEFPGCESLTAETHYCLTFADDLAVGRSTLSVLGLESGRLCEVYEIGPPLTRSTPRAPSDGAARSCTSAATAVSPACRC
jgi:hypothetical protein